jgi:glycerol kinase
VRATLEAVAFQCYDIVESMNKDSKIKLNRLLVSGGMASNRLLLQTQSDFLGIPVAKPSMMESTSFGSALAAGKAIGLWNLNDEKSISVDFEVFQPNMSEEERVKKYNKWMKAVKRSIGWNDNTIG